MSKENDTVKADRAAAAEWLRELADDIESGKIASLHAVAVTHNEGTQFRLSLLVPEKREMNALASLLFWAQTYVDYSRTEIGKIIVGTHTRGGEPAK